MQKHILSVFSQNKPGVLSRIAGLLRRKLFQIDSLTVGRTQDPTISRFTIVVEGGSEDAHKTARALEKLIEVLKVEILPQDCITREIVIAKFQINTPKEEALLKTLEEDIFTKEISRKKNEIVLELIDNSNKLERFLDKVIASGIVVKDWVRSGVIALG